MLKGIIKVDANNMKYAAELMNAISEHDEEKVEELCRKLTEAEAPELEEDEEGEEFSDEEMELLLEGANAGMSAAMDIFNMTPEERKEIFGKGKVEDIFKDKVGAFIDYVNYVMGDDEEEERTYEPGDIVFFKGEQCVMLEDKGEKLKVADCNFHSFYVNRSEIEE